MPYFSISYEDVENSQTYKALEPNFTFYSRTIFLLAQKAEEKIKLNEKVTIDNFRFISDKQGQVNLGLNLNFENEELKDFNFIKELIRNNLIETKDIKIQYNKNNLSEGKIIFGLTPKYTISMHIEELSIFCFRLDQIIYKDKDYTTEIGIDFYSSGIIAPASFYKEIVEKFFDPFIKNNTCKYIIIPKTYDSTIFCNKDFNSIEKFAKIYFNINDFEFKYSFILEGKELFMKVNNGYLFLIRTYLYYTANKWVLGLPFFGKYPVSFNLDKNLIGFDINKNNKDNKGNNNSITTWILLGALFALILIIVINLYNFVFKKTRKVRANELVEDIIYSEKKDEDIKLGI